MIYQKCTKCLLTKPLNEYGKGKLKNGSRNQCKLCVNKYGDEYRDRMGALLKDRHREWSAKNKDKTRVYSLNTRVRHPELCRERSKKWRDSNPERVKEISARTYKRNKHIIKDRLATAVKERYRRNPAEFIARVAERRGRKIKATPFWANSFYMEEAYVLSRMRNAMFPFKWHVDHIVPLKSNIVCGLHVEHNLQIIPAYENISKHNKFIQDATK